VASNARLALAAAIAVTVAGCSPSAKPGGMERKAADSEMSSIQQRMDARRKLLAPARADEGLTFGRPRTAPMRMHRPTGAPQAR